MSLPLSAMQSGTSEQWKKKPLKEISESKEQYYFVLEQLKRMYILIKLEENLYFYATEQQRVTINAELDLKKDILDYTARDIDRREKKVQSLIDRLNETKNSEK